MIRRACSLFILFATSLAAVSFVAAQTSQPTPTISDQTLNGTMGSPVQYQIVAQGATAYYVIGSTMPYGLQLSTATGVVSGTPTMSGQTTLQIKVTDSSGHSAEANLTFKIAADPNAAPPTIADQTLQGTAGTSMNAQVSATNALEYHVVSGTLPTGLNLNTGKGAVTGTPQAAGSTTVVIQVKNGANVAATGNVTIAIGAPVGPTISNQSLTGTMGTPVQYQIVAQGATAYYVIGSTMPYGLQLNTATGMVSGTPTMSGQTTMQIKVTDANNHFAEANLTFNIAADPNAPPPTIADQSLQGTAGTPMNAQVSATNAIEYHVVSGNLPTGLNLNTGNGAVTGTPPAAGNTTVTIQVKNGADVAATGNVTIAIGAPVGPTISNQSLTGTMGSPVQYQIVAQGATAYYVIGNLMPYGLKLDSATGIVSGTPTMSGQTMIQIKVTDGSGNSAQANLVVTIVAQLSGGQSSGGQSTGGTTTSPEQQPPPPASTLAQTIKFTAPINPLVVAQPVTLNATSSAGLPITYALVSGNASIKDGVLTPLSTDPVIVRASNPGNDTYSAASAQVSFGNPEPVAQQSVVAGGQVAVTTDKPLTLTTPAAPSQPVTFSVVSGPAVINGNTMEFTGSGNVTVTATTQVDATHQTTETMTVAAHPVARFVNVSSRVHVNGGGDVATVGFVVTGSAPKQMLIRAVGDSLAAFGVGDGLANPALTLYDATGAVVASNRGWGDNAQIAAAANAAGAFALTPGKTDAALLAAVNPGLYTAQVTSPNAGSVLVEVYDAAAAQPVPTKQLINVSTRAHVDANDQVVQGFVISGDQPKRVLIRAVGPSLSAFGVTDAITDPAIAVYAGSVQVASDDDWGSTAAAANGVTLGTPADIANAAASVGAFALPAGSKDAALLLTLPPGLYSAVVSGSATQSGTVLVEAYEAP